MNGRFYTRHNVDRPRAAMTKWEGRKKSRWISRPRFFVIVSAWLKWAAKKKRRASFFKVAGDTACKKNGRSSLMRAVFIYTLKKFPTFWNLLAEEKTQVIMAHCSRKIDPKPRKVIFNWLFFLSSNQVENTRQFWWKKFPKKGNSRSHTRQNSPQQSGKRR